MNTETLDIEQDLFSYKSDLEKSEINSKNDIKNEKIILNKFKTEPLVYNNNFLLKTEAYLLKLAYANNKILSLSNSRTRILAHQVESTHRVVDALSQRFLIADEVGLGKTVEAGLVIKELIYRYSYKRILIVCPASLLFQWQNEMSSKFNENFRIVDRKAIQEIKKIHEEDCNPWDKFDKIICSLDFIKSASFTEDLKNSKWDAVIFDEAHRLRRDSNHSTLTYNVGEIISERTKALLLLSATPFRGKLEELYYLIALIDKNVLGPFNSFYNEYCIENSDLSFLKDKLSKVVIRRTKKEVGGFTKRNAKTIKFELYPDERRLYEETTTYVIEEFNRAMQCENRAVGFVMTVFQKLLDSSTHALLSALKNRRRRLQEIVERPESYRKIAREIDGDDKVDVNDEMESVDHLFDLTIEKTIDEINEEIKTLTRLIVIAENIDENKKGKKVKSLIDDLKKKGNKKFIIFTQFRTTQDYLCRILSKYKIEIFNGSMNRDEKEDAINRFSEDSEILIATEAGGEGRNLQFCNILINYDLPWSPLKIEQRIGRIHRFGQRKDVFIYNFSTKDTVAERILEVLVSKLKLFEESIGTPDILLGQIEDELKLNSLFMKMANGKKINREIDSEINERIDYARKSYEKLAELTVADKMDFNYDEYYKVTLKEREFSNQRIEFFINKLHETDEHPFEYIGRKHKRNGLYPIKNNVNEQNVKGKYGTFDSQTALDNESLEFLAFGHPIVDRMIDHCCSDEFQGFTGIKMFEYNKNFTGMVFNYIVEFKSVRKTSELIPVLVELDGMLSRFDKEDIERELAGQDFFVHSDDEFLGKKIDRIIKNSDEYFESARKEILDKIESKIFDLSENLDIYIDPELEKIKKSFDKRIVELEEKLEIQKGRMKWYGKDMKSAITRTSNLIMKAKREKEYLLEKYKSYMGIKYSITMLNVGIITSA